MVGNELERGRVVEVEEEGEPLRFGPRGELDFLHSGEFAEIAVQVGGRGLERGVIDQAVLDVGGENFPKSSVGVIEGEGDVGEKKRDKKGGQ